MLREQGYPVSLDDVPETPRLLPAPNAADIWRRLLNSDPYDRGHAFFTELRQLDITNRAETIQRAADFLESESKFFATVEDAVAIEACSLDEDLRNGVPDFSVANTCLNAARMLRLKAIVLHQSGDPHGALQCLDSMMTIADHLDQQSAMIFGLVSVAVDVTVVAALEEDLLGEKVPPTALLHDAQPRLLERGRSRQARRQLQWELRMADATFAEPSPDLLKGTAYGLKLEGLAGMVYQVAGPREHDHLTFLRHYRDTMAAWEKPEAGRWAASQELERRLDRLPDSCIISKQLLAGYANWIRQLFIRDAWCRCAAAALAAERFRQQTNTLPARLADLVPAYLDGVPLDPFDGAPLRYRPDDSGFTVYSVGPNRLDEGGKRATNPPPPGAERFPDVAFRINTP